MLGHAPRDPEPSAARLAPWAFSTGVVDSLGVWAIGGIGGICFWGVWQIRPRSGQPGGNLLNIADFN